MTNSYNTYHKALHNDWLHNTPDKESTIHRPFTGQSMIQSRQCNQLLCRRRSITEWHNWPAVRRGRRTLQYIYRTKYRRDKALFPLLWFQNPRYLRQNSDLRRTASQTVQSVTDSAASPAKLRCPDDVRITEGWAKDSKKLKLSQKNKKSLQPNHI